MNLELHTTNETRAIQLVQALLDMGLDEFCVCPAARNAPLVNALEQQKHLKIYYWYEERSAAFFALGRIKSTNKPMAVVTTSGTAVAELLPAVMEAYYTGFPLICITADRPRRFRGTNAPQTAEQVGIFGQYVHYELDIEDEEYDLNPWQQTGPLHLNICFEEPAREECPYPQLDVNEYQTAIQQSGPASLLDRFLEKCRYPFIIVGALKKKDKEAVAQFLIRLQAPVFLEGVSGLREDSRLKHLQIRSSCKLQDVKYPVDGVLRIGGVPTVRLWRDLEDCPHQFAVLSINDVPFSGLSWGQHIHTPISSFFEHYIPERYSLEAAQEWIKADSSRFKTMVKSFAEKPKQEISLVHFLSRKIPEGALVYLGNSLPIREWDQAATEEDRKFEVFASRGLNGIDGQISTFLGLAAPGKSNWAIIGDLTALYDMAAFWVLPQLKDTVVTVVVINNGGGKIFEMFASPIFRNSHQLSFEPLARMWGLDYEKWTEIPDNVVSNRNRLIEIVPE